MADIDLDELFESMLKGDSSAIAKSVEVLVQYWDQEDWESIEIFAEETLTDETPSELVSMILELREDRLDLVEVFVASLDGKRIIAKTDFAILMDIAGAPREGDNEEFNASRSGRASIALNPDCPREILADLARDDKWEIRYRVALNSSTTSDILDSLLLGRYEKGFEDLAEFIEATVALHKNSSEEVLEKLAGSENPIVRTAVACNPNASLRIIDKAKSLGVDVQLINPSSSSGNAPRGFRDTRLCWWFGDSGWTLADLENLQLQ